LSVILNYANVSLIKGKLDRGDVKCWNVPWRM